MLLNFTFLLHKENSKLINTEYRQEKKKYTLLVLKEIKNIKIGC